MLSCQKFNIPVGVRFGENWVEITLFHRNYPAPLCRIENMKSPVNTRIKNSRGFFIFRVRF